MKHTKTLALAFAAMFASGAYAFTFQIPAALPKPQDATFHIPVVPPIADSITLESKKPAYPETEKTNKPSAEYEKKPCGDVKGGCGPYSPEIELRQLEKDLFGLMQDVRGGADKKIIMSTIQKLLKQSDTLHESMTVSGCLKPVQEGGGKPVPYGKPGVKPQEKEKTPAASSPGGAFNYGGSKEK